LARPARALLDEEEVGVDKAANKVAESLSLDNLAKTLISDVGKTADRISKLGLEVWKLQV